MRAWDLLRILAVSLTLAAAAARAEDWNQFLGPRTNGTSAETAVVTTWSPQQNIRWKVDLPRPGNGSAIVSAGKVLVTCAEDPNGNGRSLYCLDRRDGRQVWVRTVQYPQESATHKTNPYCGSTPAADGQRVVVWHASAGLHCYGLDGESLWSRDLGEFEHMWGYGGSPIIHQGRVYLNCSPSKTRTFVTAIDLESGKTVWETEEPMEGDGERNAAGNYMGSWASPIVIQVAGKGQIVCPHPTRLVAYDPESGDIVWWCGGLRGPRGDLAYSSALSDGKVCLTTGGFRCPSICARLGGTGDVTSTDRLWRNDSNPQSIGSGIILDDVYYMANAEPGTLQCVEVASGKELWRESRPASFWGSLVHVAGLLMVTDQNGDTLAFRPDPKKLDVVSFNKLGEHCNATPAVSEGELFLRTFPRLYCISENGK
jgi:outer membrane protein assembly factor BamB